MLINFNKKLKERTIAYCLDELEYHIDESFCANEYHDEIMAQVELLFLLGETDYAENFANMYIENEESEPRQKRAMKELMKRLKKAVN